MNWDAIAAIGQGVSALALVLVFVQVRHAREDMRRTVLDSFANSLISAMTISTEPRMLDALVKANEGLGGPQLPFVAALMDQVRLSENEARLVNVSLQAQWQAFAQVARNADKVAPSDLAGLEANMRLLYSSGLGRLWFRHAKATMNPNLRRYIENVVAQSAPTIKRRGCR